MARLFAKKLLGLLSIGSITSWGTWLELFPASISTKSLLSARTTLIFYELIPHHGRVFVLQYVYEKIKLFFSCCSIISLVKVKFHLKYAATLTETTNLLTLKNKTFIRWMERNDKAPQIAL